MTENFNYNNLWKLWADARRQPSPKGFVPVRTSSGVDNYYMTPKNMIEALNAFTPYDLYNNPDPVLKGIDYPTVAFNINNTRQGLGFPKLNVLATETSNRFPLNSFQDQIKLGTWDWLQLALRKYAPQGIYEHEKAHYQDPRLLPQSYNYGYLKRFGMPGNIASRELPAMKAEDNFWNWLAKKKKEGKR